MKKKYIWIEGKFAVYDWDEHTGERLCNYITKASPSQRQLVFCTVKCLEEYMEGRLKFLEEHRLNRLQQEAQEDFNGRV